FNLGPLGPLLRLGLAQGVELSPDLGVELDALPPELDLVPPDFAPQVRYMELAALGDLHRMWPGEVVEVPAGAPFDLLGGSDVRDSQPIPYLTADGTLGMDQEKLTTTFHATGNLAGNLLPDPGPFTL